MADIIFSLRHISRLSNHAPIVKVILDNQFPELDAIIDTGSSYSHIPSTWAEMLGHDNFSKSVKLIGTSGVGGRVVSYLHTVNIGFLDQNNTVVWETGKTKIRFTDSMDKLALILIERDIINRWSSIYYDTSSPKKSAWNLRIRT